MNHYSREVEKTLGYVGGIYFLISNTGVISTKHFRFVVADIINVAFLVANLSVLKQRKLSKQPGNIFLNLY